MQRGIQCMKGNKMKCREGCKSETGGVEHKNARRVVACLLLFPVTVARP